MLWESYKSAIFLYAHVPNMNSIIAKFGSLHERSMEITRFPFLFCSWFSWDFHENHERTKKRKPDDVDFAKFPNLKVVLRPVHMHTVLKNKTKLEILYFHGSLEISKSFFCVDMQHECPLVPRCVWIAKWIIICIWKLKIELQNKLLFGSANRNWTAKQIAIWKWK